ncbi:putative Ubiquitin thiolesterase [Paramicrosporidium saccamoebae]|uniref:Putative Ubiquitin thiolesterase n=1 Tax=Paramicrosporidium saccamoebae TaxID=1246581 RepID=A0A2H9TMK0_9FUNG|nr:putative Ubiquitin thiolesterase [Paramicrosporidium saccamoebae]
MGASLRGNLLTALDALEKSKHLLLQRFRESEAERIRSEQRSREMTEARRRDEEAQKMAARAVQSQEEARKLRLSEMQKLDLAKSYAHKTDLLNKSSSSDIAIPAMRPAQYSPTTPEATPNFTSVPLPVLSPPPTIKPALRAQYYLENGMPLRKVNIPDIIVSRFMDLAAENTRKNLETCGVLAGKLSHDVFTITTLIMPKQTSTSDTVAMLNEEEMFDVQDQRDVLTLGWIHTHPTQQCFMSSVDLHTHFPYQLLIAEAIAIVVAPTQTPNFGIFRLTDPPGIGTISNCPQRGFHQHPSDRPIYREISTPEGHAKFSRIELEIVDLRNKT